MAPLRLFMLGTIVPAVLLAAACGESDGSERRTVQIVQKDGECTPTFIQANPGEKLRFEVKNEGKKDHEVEGIDGTKLEELLVPSGRTRNINYTAPDSGIAKIKCYVPAGDATIIELKVSGEGTGDAQLPTVQDRVNKTDKAPNTTVAVELGNYVLNSDKESVAVGPTKFVARNTQGEVHELAVLREKGDGTYENLGEIEDVPPGESAEIVIDLPAGKYLLACLLIPGEAGSKTNHFKLGMHTPFEVK